MERREGKRIKGIEIEIERKTADKEIMNVEKELDKLLNDGHKERT
jgi:hypothetical protein